MTNLTTWKLEDQEPQNWLSSFFFAVFGIGAEFGDSDNTTAAEAGTDSEDDFSGWKKIKIQVNKKSNKIKINYQKKE